MGLFQAAFRMFRGSPWPRVDKVRIPAPSSSFYSEPLMTKAQRVSASGLDLEGRQLPLGKGALNVPAEMRYVYAIVSEALPSDLRKGPLVDPKGYAALPPLLVD